MKDLIKQVETYFKDNFTEAKVVFYGDVFSIEGGDIILVKTSPALFDTLSISNDCDEVVLFVEVFCYSDTIRGSQNLSSSVSSFLKNQNEFNIMNSVSATGSGLKGKDSNFGTKKWYNIVKANATKLKYR